MAEIILIFSIISIVLGNWLARPVTLESKQEIWRGLNRVDKNRLADKFTEEERVKKIWPDDYR